MRKAKKGPGFSPGGMSLPQWGHLQSHGCFLRSKDGQGSPQGGNNLNGALRKAHGPACKGRQRSPGGQGEGQYGLGLTGRSLGWLLSERTWWVGRPYSASRKLMPAGDRSYSWSPTCHSTPTSLQHIHMHAALHILHIQYPITHTTALMPHTYIHLYLTTHTIYTLTSNPHTYIHTLTLYTHIYTHTLTLHIHKPIH